MSGRVRGPSRVRAADNGVARWWWPADLAVLGVLVVLGSALVTRTYGSLAPMLATTAGALVAVLVLVVIRRWGMPGWVAAPAIAVGLLMVGAVVVAPELARAGLLPSAAGTGTVLRGAVGGWRELLSVATPTGVTGTLLVPPLLIGAVGTALAGWIAAGRRPELALSVPAGGAVLFALLGDRAARPVAVAILVCGGVVAGVSWVVWVSARARRRQVARFAGGTAVRRPAGNTPASRSRRTFTARRTALAVAVLVAACGIGTLTAVAAAPDRLALRDLAEPSTDPAGFVSPLSTFRSYTGERADAVQLTVQGLAPGVRLRVAALDYYDGRQFSVSDAVGPFVRIGSQRPDAATGGGPAATVSVQIDDYRGPYLPLPGPVTRLTFTGARASALTADLRYSDDAATGLLPGGWQPGDGYSVLAPLPETPTAAQLAAATVQPMDLPTSVALPDAVRAAAGRYVAGVSGAGAQVEAIRAGLAADGVFSHGTESEPRSAAGHGLDRLSAMVTDPVMVGDQEQYAALMALMVRAVGLPARVGVGFVVPAPDPAGTETTGADDDAAAGADAATADGTVLRGRDISAWVEVPLAGLGWVAFDPAPAADKSDTAAQDRSQAERRAVAVPAPPALQPGQPDAVDADGAGQRAEPPAGDPPASPTSGWPMLLLATAGWLLLALAVAAIPVVLILAVKHARRRRRRAGDPRSQIAGGWEHLVGIAVDTGYRPAPWYTRTETAADLAADGILRVDWLAPAADAAEFAPVDGREAGGAVTQDRATAYWREVDDRGAELLAGLPLWRRWRARLSLASMRRLDRR